MKYPYILLTGPQTEYYIAARMPDSLPPSIFLKFLLLENSVH